MDLAGRDLTGAELSFADIRHVNFARAILRDAKLGFVWAEQAGFFFAELQGADLDGAQLQGASLYGAYFQRTRLDHVQLQGASLEGADLQGASLFQAYLQGASFKGVLCAWRANARKAVWKDTRVELQKVELEKVPECNWSAARGEDEMVKIWAARERESPAPEA